MALQNMKLLMIRTYLLKVGRVVFIIISLDKRTKMINQLQIPRIALCDFLQATKKTETIY
jgi:hypothetical protein